MLNADGQGLVGDMARPARWGWPWETTGGVGDPTPVAPPAPEDLIADIGDLPRRLDVIGAELTALCERFGLDPASSEDLARYTRRLQSRLTSAIDTIVEQMPTEAAAAADTVVDETQTVLWLPGGPTGLGTSAARVGVPGAGSGLDDRTNQGDEDILQDVDFGCPWPLRVSPFLDPARNHALAWMLEFGLTQDPEANERQYRDWKLGEAAAYFYPDATPEGLDLAADLMGWYFAPFDDEFDNELGRDPLGAAALCGDLIAVLDLPDDTPLPVSYPVVVAFADIWRRSNRGMSNAWRQRAAQHWKKYIIGQLAEVINRKHRRTLDPVSHLRQRVATTSSDSIADLFEPVSGYEVPDLAWHVPMLDELRQLGAEIVSITNDLVSADKEEAQGDTTNNLLLILEYQEHCSRGEAIARMRQMTHERFARFLRLEQQVPDLDDVLTPDGSVAVRRHVAGLHDLLAGDNEWEHTSGRYSTKNRQNLEQEPSRETPPVDELDQRGFRRFLTWY